MNTVKKAAVSVKNTVRKHQGVIFLTVIAGAQVVALRKHDAFLKDHDLYNEFHNIEV